MADLEFEGIRAASAVDALAIAAANSKLPEMKRLLTSGVDINGTASYCGGTALHEAVNNGQTRAVEILIEAGADLNVTHKFDLTPLMCACSNGKTKGSQIASRLIEAGTDVHYVRSKDEMTALKFAAGQCEPHVLQALLTRGAQVDGPPGTDQTALMIAARNNNVPALKVLVENGADLMLQCKIPWAQGRTAEGLAELEKRRAALNYLREVRGDR